MSYEKIILEDRIPLTKDMLIHDFHKLGIKKGDFVLVHSSLNEIGYIIGKERTLVEALIDVIGYDGLIVMPAHTSDNFQPEKWENPPVPKSWFKSIKENMPAYDKDTSPTVGVGVVPEYFRKLKDVYRSNHPQVSFAAYGKKSKELLKYHPFDYSLDDDSPLGLMYQWKFKILMLGTDYTSCTAMHLSEYRSKCREEIILEASAMVNGKRQWIKFKDLDIDSDDFDKIGKKYEELHPITIGKVGYAESRLIDMVSLIDFTSDYLSK